MFTSFWIVSRGSHQLAAEVLKGFSSQKSVQQMVELLSRELSRSKTDFVVRFELAGIVTAVRFERIGSSCAIATIETGDDAKEDVLLLRDRRDADFATALSRLGKRKPAIEHELEVLNADAAAVVQCGFKSEISNSEESVLDRCAFALGVSFLGSFDIESN